MSFGMRPSVRKMVRAFRAIKKSHPDYERRVLRVSPDIYRDLRFSMGPAWGFYHGHRPLTEWRGYALVVDPAVETWQLDEGPIELQPTGAAGATVS